MAYNRENFLKKVLKVQELALRYRKQDLFFKEIFYKHVENQFNISKRTFDSYMGINAKKQLKEIQEKKQQNNQLNLF
jgi:hypothetical protein